MQGQAAYMTAYPAFKKTTPPGVVPGLAAMPYGNDGRETAKASTVEPGKLFPFDVSPIDQPRVGADADKLVGSIREMLELALPSVIQGVVAQRSVRLCTESGGVPGAAGLGSDCQQCSGHSGDRVGFESWLIERRIGEKVYAWGEIEAKKGKKTIGGMSKAAWLGVGPDDLKGVHRYEARLDPSYAQQ